MFGLLYMCLYEATRVMSIVVPGTWVPRYSVLTAVRLSNTPKSMPAIWLPYMLTTVTLWANDAVKANIGTVMTPESPTPISELSAVLVAVADDAGPHHRAYMPPGAQDFGYRSQTQAPGVVQYPDGWALISAQSTTHARAAADAGRRPVMASQHLLLPSTLCAPRYLPAVRWRGRLVPVISLEISCARCPVGVCMGGIIRPSPAGPTRGALPVPVP